MEEEVALEEGEIEDNLNEDCEYRPLPRPENYAQEVSQRFPPVNNISYSDSEEESASSNSDSDLDSRTQIVKKPKRVKLQPKVLPRSTKHKKYDIWSTRMQEDVLAETFNSCDVTYKDRSRNVESYDYSLARKYYEQIDQRQGNKRTRDDRKNSAFKFKDKPTNKERNLKGKPRIIPDLNVDINCINEDIAKDIANKLCEEREDLVLKILDAMGKEKTFELFEETRRIEKEGGMLIMNQTRRRTPGGLFLYLVRNDYHITPEQKQKIFEEDRQKFKEMLKEKRKKRQQKFKDEAAKSKLLPDLLTHAELLASKNPNPKTNLDALDEGNCTNPPPSPETDHQESGDGMGSGQITSLVNDSHSTDNSMENTRGRLKTYDDDFLDIGCSQDMDLF
ncbi:phosphorylated adapter RNA export protein [Cylas formicarius]|uniref:phosphorylated adapter RNA export protein n=1 Tax=Cylas formicarius TaxID=197179 RepID=UPI002958D6CF|nr:phosphorylated adapter RNA export protein [Cylas formicarius]